MAIVTGIDVSHFNGAVDWAAVAKTGTAFAYCKATEGTDYVDTQFVANYTGIANANLLRGAYHFFRPAKDAQAQADHFLAHVPALGQGDLPPAFDIEVSDGQKPSAIIDAMHLWLDAVEAKLGRRPVIYTSASFWAANLASSDAFGKYPLWVAHYTAQPAPKLPTGWAAYTFWQFAEHGTVSGIVGSVDMDRFSGTLDDLKALRGG